MSYVGIDYGLGTSNIDKYTGIRYGVINMQDLHEWAHESFEPDYGEATCPKCGNEATDADTNYAEWCEQWEHGRGSIDWLCIDCEYVFSSDEAYPEEPQGNYLEDSDYSLSMDDYGDIWILRSPYYTYAQYCSPCAPGAGHLAHPLPQNSGAPKVYCLGVEWFQDGKAPYKYWRVIDDKLVTQGKI